MYIPMKNIVFVGAVALILGYLGLTRGVSQDTISGTWAGEFKSEHMWLYLKSEARNRRFSFSSTF